MLASYKNYFLYFLSILWNIALIFILFSTRNSADLKEFFHADLLSFPTLYKDIFIDGYSFFDWSIGGATYLIPDRILYLSLLGIFDNFRIAALAFTTIQIVSILLLFYAIIKQIYKDYALQIATFSAILFSLFIIQAMNGLTFYFSIFLFLCNYHVGAFLLLLASLWLTLKYLQNSKKSTLIWLVILQIVSAFSDRLYVILYTIPIGIVFGYFWLQTKNRKYKIIFIYTIISLFVGILLHKSLIWFKIIHLNANYNIFTFKKSIESFGVLYSQIHKYILLFDSRSLIIILSFLLFTYSIIKNVPFLLKKRFTNQEISVQQVFVAFFCIFFITTLLIQPLNGNYFAFWLIRYIVPIFYLSLLAIPLILFSEFPIKIYRVVALSSIGIIIIVSTIFIFQRYKNQSFTQGFTSYINYYPSLVNQVDSLATKYNAKYGVSSFFDAKVITTFSKKDLRVYSVYEHFAPWVHGCNHTWYKKNTGRYNNPIFTFAIVKMGDNNSKAEEHIGKPIKVDTLGGYLFKVYNPFYYTSKSNNPIPIIEK